MEYSLNEADNLMPELTDTGYFFDVIAIILIDIVFILTLIKIFKFEKPFAFNGESGYSYKKVTDLKKWNKAHGIGIIIYGIVLNVVFIYPMLGFGIDDGLIDGLIFFGSILLGLIALVIQHSVLVKKYVVNSDIRNN